MVQISTLLAGLAAVLTISAAPIIVPIGSTGQSLVISEDGQTISLGSKSMNVKDVMNGAASCKGKKGHGGKKVNGGKKGDGGKKGAGKGQNSPGKGAPPAAGKNAKAVYFITNAKENAVVALKVGADGKLADGSITPTGGAGLTGNDAKGAPAVPDGLFSQGSVKAVGKNLIAVNPGSNTMTLFTIDAADATKLTMVGKPVSTLGDFPMSVTISAALSQACVANSGTAAGVACFSISDAGLTALDTAQRPFQLNQSNPPVGPFNTVSQTFFNSDSTALLTTVKGDPTVNNTGFLSVFPVANGKVSTTETRSSPAGTAVLFGTALLPGSKNSIFVTDASFGSATLSLSGNGTAAVTAQTKIADQKATCWAAFSELTGTAFVTDVAKNHLVEVDTASGTLIKDLESANGNPGMIDLVSAGSFVYALSPGSATVKPAVTVFDVSGGKGAAKEIQNFAPTGVEITAQGMTFV